MATSESTTIPYGYCHCGCGQKTNLVTKTNTAKGYRKGEPMRFIVGHRPDQNNPAKRFWAKVNIATANECWEWQAGTKPNGYGYFHVCDTTGKMRAKYCHRYSWELTNGDVPDGLQVLHSCDNRRCVNPNHLFLGTQLDNMRDMTSKNRQARGEKRSKKLTEEQVQEIRTRVMAGEQQKTLASEMGVSRAIVSLIVNYRKWKI